MLAPDSLRGFAVLARRHVLVLLQRVEAAFERAIAVREPLRLVLEQPVGAGEPAASDRALLTDASVLVCELDRDDCRADDVPGRDITGVGPLEERYGLGDVVGEVRAPREQLEIRRLELGIRRG